MFYNFVVDKNGYLSLYRTFMTSGRVTGYRNAYTGKVNPFETALSDAISPENHVKEILVELQEALAENGVQSEEDFLKTINKFNSPQGRNDND